MADKHSDNDDARQEEPEAPAEGVPAPSGDVNLIDTDYKIGQDNIQTKFLFDVDMHGKVFGISALLVTVFVILTLALQDQAGPIFNTVRNWLTAHLSWLFMIASNIFVLLCVGIIFTPLGKVRLGGSDAKPDHSYLGWFAMLFAAGMGIGLMFYGVSEPMTHYSDSMAGGASAPLAIQAADPGQATDLGMAATIFHWGLHPWAIYAVVALALALFSFNKGLPLTMRSILYPVLGERVWGWPGHLVDILAVFSTLFGLATSLGLGAEQAAAGLNFLFGMPNTEVSKVLLICAITGVALVSVAAGVDKGVKRLSELNMVLAVLLLLFVLFTGPTMSLLGGFFSNLVAYGKELPGLANPFGRDDTAFVQDWTAFYWAWWISWSPFVGTFIARVSRGRTVREFLMAVLIVPTLITVLWMTVFGGTAIDQVAGGMKAVADATLELKLFVMLEHLPLTSITSFIGIVLVIVFFVTSSDSGSLVIDSITAGGKLDAPTSQRVFWALIEGAVAITLLLGGGLGAMQAAVVSTGLPFTIILLLACVAIIQGLRSEPKPG
ncbi:BCCT family transporter [Larsenimonas rhizosphaerae]|uniref:BCCT family transporter n=1 Tax=Larsenimonas rhizosphaerae TaxID=2944682 RepID=A0AA42CUM7_9GAMM|nr:BCCT family transporter [Larsenimonas rhizosphaerae]MCM2129481.1 BCCT family transporter [Larsenimonas rhizosphaerae]MCX2524136.1 BCCT family transporter [Larsenimonas rhizosphaerae]